MYLEDTIGAIATAPGEGSIGIIRLSGPQAIEIAEKIFYRRKDGNLAAEKNYTLHYGHIVNGEKVIDEGLLLLMRAPKSYTGEDVVEFQIHGGLISLRETLELCLQNGARLAIEGEFTERAFLNGRLDLSQAEAVMDIVTARSEESLHLAVSHLEGSLSVYVQRQRAELTELIAQLAVTVDYPEEDIEELTALEVKERLLPLFKKTKEVLENSNSGRILKDGLRTVIVGAPNVGKSSLLNAILQEERAIVTAIPGTTRDTIEEYISVAGIPLRLIDTAGLRETENEVERIGVNNAKQKLATADLVLAVFDGSLPIKDIDCELLDSLKDKKVIVLLNKADLPLSTSSKDIKVILPSVQALEISAVTGSGLNVLANTIREMVFTEGISASREVLIANTRHIELIRQVESSLSSAIDALEAGLPADCVIVDLEDARDALGRIIGVSLHEDMIHEIFSRFCLGK